LKSSRSGRIQPPFARSPQLSRVEGYILQRCNEQAVAGPLLPFALGVARAKHC
jgi:hypothetical protein